MAENIVVYRGHDNVVEFTLTRYNELQRKDVPVDFSSVERMIVALPTTNPMVAFDSDLTPGVITWNAQGVITLDIQQYALPVGGFPIQMVGFSPEDPDGFVYVDPASDEIVLEVREILSMGLLPPPLPGNGDAAVRQAGEEISALRAVYELDGQVFYLDSQDVEHAPLYLGVTITSAIVGGDVIVQRAGTIDDSGWSWAAAEVFVGATGFLTQTAPTTGFKLIVGNSPAPTRLNLAADTPVYL